MAKTTSLKAETRQRSGSSAINRMRNEGFTPAVIYGRSRDNANLKVPTRAISDLLGASATDNILVDLEIDGESKSQLSLIQDVQHDYLKNIILHVDFRAVADDETITAAVPIHLVGTCIGVKNGGLLDHQLHSTTVQCLPKDLPEELVLDVSNLDVNETAHISDLKTPEGVKPALGAGVVVAMVQETRAAKAAAAEGGEAAAATDAAAE